MYVESTRFNQLEISPNLPIVWFFSSFENIASWDAVISPGKRKNEPEKACKEYNFIINSRCWKYITSATDLDEIALLHLLPGWNDIIISAGAVSLKVICLGMLQLPICRKCLQSYDIQDPVIEQLRIQSMQWRRGSVKECENF